MKSEAKEGVMHLWQNFFGFEGAFWQIRKILRYEKPYFL